MLSSLVPIFKGKGDLVSSYRAQRNEIGRGCFPVV